MDLRLREDDKLITRLAAAFQKGLYFTKDLLSNIPSHNAMHMKVYFFVLFFL